MKKIVLLLIFIALCLPAFAADVIEPAANPGGGGIKSNLSEEFKMEATFGEPAGGQMSAGDTSIRLSILGGGVGADESDFGQINDTRIYRVGDAQGSDIEIRFRSMPAVSKANIFRASGTGLKMPPSSSYQLIAQDVVIQAPGTASDTVWKDPSLKVGDGVNAYYRIVPNSVTSNSNIFGQSGGISYNMRTAVKFDVSLAANKTDLLTIPLVSTSSIGVIEFSNNIFGGMIDNGYLLCNDGGLKRLDCVNKQWNSYSELIPGKGFWLISYADTKLTFTGFLLNEAFQMRLAYQSELYGYPDPVSVDASSLGISPRNGDYALINQNGLIRYDYIGNAWHKNFNIGMGKGFWYYNPIPAEQETRYFGRPL